VELALDQLVRRHLVLRGIHNYQPHHLLSAVQFVTDHHRQFPLASLVTKMFPLSQIDDALRAAGQPENIRVGICNDV
jgi:threonine dehydrogenase-like Zn-dependent dehydrogenase